MLKSLIGYLVFVISLFACLDAAAADMPFRTDHQLTTYWYTTDKRVTIAWDANTDYQMGDQFEIKAVWLETSTEYLLVTVPDLTYTVQAPRVGHFEFWLRTRRGTEFSPWIRSSDPASATVDGQPKGWLVYWQLAAPGGVIIGLNLSTQEIRNENRNENSPMEPCRRPRHQRVQPVLREWGRSA